MSDAIYMYWLSTLYAIGSRKQNLLLEHLESAQTAYAASLETLRTIPSITEHNIRTIQKSRSKFEHSNGMDMLQRMGISFTYLGHRDYPSLLSEISDPPVGLFYIGKLPDNTLHRVAIIGSRKCSEYGLNTAQRLGAALARKDVVIVSGMARGIDGMAHRGALEAAGLTIAVLGCGVDICYPAENRSLRDSIAKSGCIISEYPPGVTPRAGFFPARNRIISGLSQIVIVVESAKKSGTLITVDQALEQGRDVMAVPGNVTNKYSEGTNDLIKQGAEPVCKAEDVLHMLNTATIHMPTLNIQKKTKASKESAPYIAPEEKLVYDVLAFEPSTFDEILIKTNSQPQTIQYLLTMLELKGHVKKLPGARYIKI